MRRSDILGLRVVALMVDTVVVLLLVAVALTVLYAVFYDEVDAADLDSPTYDSCEAFRADEPGGECVVFGDDIFVRSSPLNRTWLMLAYALPVAGIGSLLQGSRGVTPGKLLTRLRTVRHDGRPPGIFAASIRTMALAVDAVAFWVLISRRTWDHRRLGDIWARTFVVDKRTLQQTGMPTWPHGDAVRT